MQVIRPNDLILASTVIAGKGILIINNISDFGRVDGLKVENWTG